MLELQSISACYGAIQALDSVSLKVDQGQIVCLLGANGAGKSTTLNCISGMVELSGGGILFEGRRIASMAANAIVREGIVQVPEGREIFPELSVYDNLCLGTWIRRRSPDVARDFERIYAYFPRLRERSGQAAGTLSGGEQQMLMIGRALMARPKLLLLDEPSLGLSPRLVQDLFEIIKQIRKDGISILLVEQNAMIALGVSDYAYVMENGEVRVHGAAGEMMDNPEVRHAYLGM